MKLKRTTRLHPALIFIAPALDVILTLIFFVVLSTSFLLQPGVAVSVPDSPFLLPPQGDSQVVSVTAAPVSAIYYENQQVSLDVLREKLTMRRGNRRTIIIKADRQAPFEQVARVMAVSLELGYATVMATSEES